MRFIDIFAGIGGFRKGLELSGHNCVYSCEIDNNARKSYSAIHNTNEEIFATDITKINIEEIPPYDMFCGGFPCQPFSRAGRRDAFNDVNKGNLFFDVIKVVKQTQPRIVFLENVKGLLTAGEKETIESEDGSVKKVIEIDKGSTFRQILEEFDTIGYDVQWQLINSAEYIAHKRERVYIIAHKRNRENNTFRRIFPIQDEIVELNKFDFARNLSSAYDDFKSHIDKKSIRYFEIANDCMYIIERQKENLNKLQDEKEVASDIIMDNKFKFNTVSPWGHWGIMINGKCVTLKVKYECKKVFALKDILQNHDTVDEKDILSEQEVEKQRYAKSAKTWIKSGNKMGNMAFPDNLNKPSRTLTANSSGREMMVIGFEKDGIQKYRKLTSLEYWKLQGFSEEDYNRAVEAGVPDTQLKKQAGNAVTVNVIKAIGARLI